MPRALAAQRRRAAGGTPPPAQHVDPPLRAVSEDRAAAARPSPSVQAASTAYRKRKCGRVGHGVGGRGRGVLEQPAHVAGLVASRSPGQRGAQRVHRRRRRRRPGRPPRTARCRPGTGRPATGPPRPARRTPRRPGCRVRRGCGRARGAAPCGPDRAATSMVSPSSAHGRAHRPGRESRPKSGRRTAGAPRRRRTAAAGADRSARRCHSRCCSALQLARSPAAGTRTMLVRRRGAGVGVDHRVVARQRLGRGVGLGQHPPGPGQRDPQRELGDQRRPAPQRLDAGHVLAGEHEVDALRPAAPGQILQQVTASAATASRPAEQHLELVDHRDDPRPAPARVLGPQLGQLGDLVPLRRARPAGAARRPGTAAAPARTPGRC